MSLFESGTDDAQRGSPQSGDRRGESMPTERIGRYILLRRLGVGGMGAVYAAYDPKLNRQVALKLLHPGLVSSESARRRLLREARALARLSHGNVVQVHDVDVSGSDVYVVMEFVQGTSLRQFCKPERNPGWRRILEVYLAAARGLAAAHDKGLVHRDFKPTNVLVNDKGTVKVVDFGLAASALDDSLDASLGTSSATDERTQSDAGATASENVSTDFVEADTAVAAGADGRLPGIGFRHTPATDRRRSGGRLTITGVVMGTPAYMAPEQHEGGEIDLSADIYAFCVSLHEGIYGHLPFAIEEFGNSETDQLQILRHKLTREFVASPDGDSTPGGDVPEWIRSVILRGLQPEPADRWPSMHTLIDALKNDPVARRRERLRLVGGGLLLLLLLAVALYGWLRDGRASPQCHSAGAEIAAVWNPEISDRIARAFARSGRANANATHERLSSLLDTYAHSWVTMKDSACAATYIRGEQSQRFLDLRMQCLDRRKHRLEALTDVLLMDSDKNLSPEVIDKSVPAAMQLPAIVTCADMAALTAAYPPPDDLGKRARVLAADRRLDRAEALEEAGQYLEGLRVADELLDESRSLDYPPLQARTLFAVARLSDKSSDPGRAESSLRAAIGQGARARDDLQAAHMWTYLIRVVGVVQARHDDALALRLAAEAAVLRADDAVAKSELYSTLGRIFGSKGQFDDAMAMHQQALALGQSALGDGHLKVAAALNEMGNLQYHTGRYQEAIDSYEQVLAIREAALGPMHPEVARALNNMGIAFAELSDFARARTMHERALAIREEMLGAEHLRLAASLNNLGRVLQRMGRHKRSRDLHERALNIRLGKLGGDHPLVASARVNLGITLYSLGDHAGAREQLRAGLTIRKQRLGEIHPDVARTYVHLARANALLGDVPSASSQYEQALVRIEKSLGEDHAVAIMALTGLGRVAIQRRDWSLARQHLLRALAIQERTVGLEHFEAIPVFMALGDLSARTGETDSAIDHWNRALELAEKVDSGLLADCRLGLAQALWSVNDERPRAQALAERASKYFQSIGHRTRVAEIERWLTGPIPEQ